MEEVASILQSVDQDEIDLFINNFFRNTIDTRKEYAFVKIIEYNQKIENYLLAIRETDDIFDELEIIYSSDRASIYPSIASTIQELLNA